MSGKKNRLPCNCAGIAPGYPQHEHWCQSQTGLSERESEQDALVEAEYGPVPDEPGDDPYGHLPWGEQQQQVNYLESRYDEGGGW